MQAKVIPFPAPAPAEVTLRAHACNELVDAYQALDTSKTRFLIAQAHAAMLGIYVVSE